MVRATNAPNVDWTRKMIVGSEGGLMNRRIMGRNGAWPAPCSMGEIIIDSAHLSASSALGVNWPRFGEILTAMLPTNNETIEKCKRNKI